MRDDSPALIRASSAAASLCARGVRVSGALSPALFGSALSGGRILHLAGEDGLGSACRRPDPTRRDESEPVTSGGGAETLGVRADAHDAAAPVSALRVTRRPLNCVEGACDSMLAATAFAAARSAVTVAASASFRFVSAGSPLLLRCAAVCSPRCAVFSACVCARALSAAAVARSAFLRATAVTSVSTRGAISSLNPSSL
eukprot:6182512-Pleurochrysis_carterae.AAC.3